MNIRKSHLLASNRNNGSVPLRIICRYFAEYRSFPLENSCLLYCSTPRTEMQSRNRKRVELLVQGYSCDRMVFQLPEQILD